MTAPERSDQGSPDDDLVAAALRPRYGRLAAFSLAVLVTLVTMLGGVGLLPGGGSPSYAAVRPAQVSDAAQLAAHQRAPRSASHRPEATPSAGRQEPDPTPAAGGTAADSTGGSTSGSTGGSTSGTADPGTTGDAAGAVPVPGDSGTGKRVVFSISQQRVWLVRGNGSVRRSYLVSGSVTDNLKPGAYQVYSKSPDAVGVDDSGTMRYMVRFAYGAHAAIGFHDIPVKDGHLVQTRDQLGTPMSHGCVRQWRPDAKALWRFAPVGTEVDVTA